MLVLAPGLENLEPSGAEGSYSHTSLTGKLTQFGPSADEAMSKGSWNGISQYGTSHA